MTIKKESGENRKFSTGAERQHSEGKGTPVLFPGDAYIEVCKHFEAGAQHYEARNWEKGIPLSELINSMERHIADEKMGDTSERHDRAMAWNDIVYLATKIRIQRGLLPIALDDMPRYERQDVYEIDVKSNVMTASEAVEQQVSMETLPPLPRCEATIECVPSRGWQIRLANGMFLSIDYAMEDDKLEFYHGTIPYYYVTKKDAEQHLTDYLRSLT